MVTLITAANVPRSGQVSIWVSGHPTHKDGVHGEASWESLEAKDSELGGYFCIFSRKFEGTYPFFEYLLWWWQFI